MGHGERRGWWSIRTVRGRAHSVRGHPWSHNRSKGMPARSTLRWTLIGAIRRRRRLVHRRLEREKGTYAAKATGPYRPQLVQFFLAEVADEQLHAQFLANKIVALGGEPATRPCEVAPASTNRQMREAVLQAERDATKAYTERAQEAEALGDKALVVQLEDMVRDESGHSEETERMLRDWPL